MPNRIILSLLLCASCLIVNDAGAAVESNKKYFKIIRANNKKITIQPQGSSASPFKHLRNYKSSRRALVTRNISKDRDMRGLYKKSGSGDLTWPIPERVDQRISSPFGYRIHPVTGKRAFHKGVDIAAAHGTPVQATHDGVVEEVRFHKNLGRFVKVRHSHSEYSMYGHLSKATVTEGERINAGDMVGNVGSTGRSTGPHLDYSLRRNGEAVDPMKFLTPPARVSGVRVSLLQ